VRWIEWALDEWEAIFFVLACIVVAAGYLCYWRPREKRNLIRGAAEGWTCRFTTPGLFRTIEAVMRGENGAEGVIRVEEGRLLRIETNRGLPARVRLIPSSVEARPLAGAQPVSLQHKTFDAAFRLEADDFMVAGDVMTVRELRHRLSQELPALRLFVDHHRTVAVVPGGRLADVTMVMWMVSFVARKSGGDAPVQEGEGCATCGSKPDETMIACKCGVKQHRGCWELFAGCARFRCRGG